MQRIVLFNLTQEVYPAPPSSSRKKSDSFFHNFAFQVNKCPLYGQMETGALKVDLGATMQRTVLFNLTQESLPSPTILFKKKIAELHFFTILLHSR